MIVGIQSLIIPLSATPYVMQIKGPWKFLGLDSKVFTPDCVRLYALVNFESGVVAQMEQVKFFFHLEGSVVGHSSDQDYLGCIEVGGHMRFLFCRREIIRRPYMRGV